MCKAKKYHKTSNTRIDKCMRKLVRWLNIFLPFEIKACCCGHGKYPMTLVVMDSKLKIPYEIFSGKNIPRKRNFYKRDGEGYYYIPEVLTSTRPKGRPRSTRSV